MIKMKLEIKVANHDEILQNKPIFKPVLDALDMVKIVDKKDKIEKEIKKQVKAKLKSQLSKELRKKGVKSKIKIY